MGQKLPYGTTLKYFEMGDVPVRCLAPGQWPEILRQRQWEPFYDLETFTREASPISQGAFETLVMRRGGQP